MPPFDDIYLAAAFNDGIAARFTAGLRLEETESWMETRTVPPARSWRLVALEQTLPQYPGLVTSAPAGRRLSGLIGPDTEAPPPPGRIEAPAEMLRPVPPAWQRFKDGLVALAPEWLFIRILELLRYPAVVYHAALDLLQDVLAQVASLAEKKDQILQMGRLFLGGIERTASRLRQGGLFPEERAAVNVLGLGLLGQGSRFGQLLTDLHRIWASVRAWIFPTQVEPGGLQFSVRQRPFDWSVHTSAGLPLVSTQVRVDADTRLIARTDRLPEGFPLAVLLDEHHRRVLETGETRLAWLRVGTEIIILLVRYALLGPAGLMTAGLRLLLEGLLQVLPNGRLALVNR